jgi:hypothetical protein
MRFSEILREDIANPPRNIKNFFAVRIREIDAIQALIEQAAAGIEKYRNGDQMLERFLQYGSDHSDDATYLDVLSGLTHLSWGDARRIERLFPLTDLRRAMQNCLDHGGEFLKYVSSAFQYLDTIHERTHAVIALLDVAEKGAQDYGYADGDDDPDYVEAMGLLKALRVLAQAVARADKVCSGIRKAMEALDAQKAAAYWGKPTAPDHDEIEVLYHASIHAAEIAKEGFKTERPEKRGGVGNYGQQATISFTHDFKIAHDILRAFRELWMIVHGQITSKHLMQWMDSEGIDYRKPEFVSSLGISRGTTDNLSGYRLAQAHELKDPKEVARLYTHYLWHTQLRSNPVFASLDNLVDVLAGVALNDIGILACRVQLDRGEEYYPAEREFRVTPDAVLSVDRVR